MSTLSVTTITGANTIKSGTASTPPTIQDSNGTQVGTFCRAWVNFNGTGTVAILASFNVTSITDNNTGDYTVNFTNALVDGNYCLLTGPDGFSTATAGGTRYLLNSALSTSARVIFEIGTTDTDSSQMHIAIFR